MPRIGKYTHIYYSTLKCKSLRNIFADEIHKKKFLDLISLVQHKKNFEVFAYCIMDNEVHLLVGTDNAKELISILKNLNEEYTAYYHNVIPGHPCGMLENHYKLNLENAQEVLEYCIRIHLIPFMSKVVQHLGDYWWCSYNDYMGKYDSGIINAEALMSQLDVNEESAVKKFKVCHKKRLQMLG